MERRYLFLSALLLVTVGCGRDRDLVGEWTVLDAKDAPHDMVRLVFSDETHLTLESGQVCSYHASLGKTVNITFPSGQTYTYGFSRSGELLTLVDGGRKIKYQLNQP